jgi:hypothetical protein
VANLTPVSPLSIVNLRKDVTSCVVDSSGKVAASVIYAGGQLAACGVFTTVMHFELQISSRIFLEKIELYCKGIIGARTEV